MQITARTRWRRRKAASRAATSAGTAASDVGGEGGDGVEGSMTALGQVYRGDRVLSADAGAPPPAPPGRRRPGRVSRVATRADGGAGTAGEGGRAVAAAGDRGGGGAIRRAYYAESIAGFLGRSVEEVMGHLATAVDGALEAARNPVPRAADAGAAGDGGHRF